MEIDQILSEEFLEFSEKIREIIEEKKAEKERFKALYMEYELKMKELSDRAQSLKDEWEAAVESQKD